MTSAEATRQLLRSRFGEPSAHVRAKFVDHLDEWLRRFIMRSPFVVVGSVGAEGQSTVSPRGGKPGFVRIVDDSTLLLPDYRGNNLFETAGNVATNPSVALLFLIPGFNEAARIIGRASLMEATAIEPVPSEQPTLQFMRIEVLRGYYHCGRAVKLAELWDPDQISRNRRDPPVPKRPSMLNQNEVPHAR